MTRGSGLSLTWRAASFLLVVAVALACWRALLDPRFVMGDPYDFIRQFLPQRTFQVNALASLAFPSWNPLDTMGVPYIASFQPAFFAPSTLPLATLLALIGGGVTPKILSAWQVAHLAFGGLGVLVCARLLRLSPWAGLAGGITYSLSGFLVGQAGHVNQQNTAAWIPWVLAALLHLARAPGLWRAALAAFSVGSLTLAGHPQIAAYGLVVACVAGIALGVRHGPRSAAWLGASAAAGLCLAAVQLLPLLQYGRVATRGATGYGYATTYSTPRAHLLLFLAPHALGDSAASYTGTPSLGEYYGYAGLLPLVLIPLALGHRRRVLAWTLLGGAFCAALFALGRYGPLYRPVYALAAPLLERFRNPGRAIVVFDLAMALLLCLSVDRLAREPGVRRTASLLLAATAGAVIALVATLPTIDGSAPRSRGLLLALALLAALALVVARLPVPLLAAFVLIDLTLSTAAAFLIDPSEPLYKDAAAAVHVRALEGLGPGELPEFRVESDAGTLPLEQNDGSVLGLAKTMGDDSLVFAPYVELRATLGFLNAQGVQLGLFGTDALASPLLDAIGVRYLFTERPPAALSPAAREKYQPLRSVQGVWIYSNPEAFPLGWIVGGRVDPPAPSAYEKLDLRSYAAVSEDDLSGRPLAGPGPAGHADVVAQDLSWIRFGVDVDRGPGAVLVTSLIDYPGWTLSVDGRAAHGFRVNHAFRGAWLPPGRYVVEWRFVNNRPLRVGILVSGLTVVILTGALVLGRMRS